jgi:hypothetical protein
MNQAPTEYKSKPTINQIPTVLSKGSLFIRWYLKSSLSPFLFFKFLFFLFFNFFLTKPGRRLINIYGEQNGEQNQEETHRKTEESVESY